ncbi:MAG: hypothetical protein WKF76_02580 [Nocardioidaceae bacterium]
MSSGLMLARRRAGTGRQRRVRCSCCRAGQTESLNVRGAYLEVQRRPGRIRWPSSAPHVVIWATGFTRADAIASAVIGLLILPRTWRLLREAIEVLLESTPKNVDLAQVRDHHPRAVARIVSDVHDLHAWTITSGVPVLSAHIVVDDLTLADGGRRTESWTGCCDCLKGHFDVDHCTFQLEPDRAPRPRILPPPVVGFPTGSE